MKKKINIFIMKNEKIFMVQIWNGLLPICIARKILYCNLKARRAWCIAIHYWKVKCIAIDIVLQAGRSSVEGLYCKRAAGKLYRNTKIVL